MGVGFGVGLGLGLGVGVGFGVGLGLGLGVGVGFGVGLGLGLGVGVGFGVGLGLGLGVGVGFGVGLGLGLGVGVGFGVGVELGLGLGVGVGVGVGLGLGVGVGFGVGVGLGLGLGVGVGFGVGVGLGLGLGVGVGVGVEVSSCKVKTDVAAGLRLASLVVLAAAAMLAAAVCAVSSRAAPFSKFVIGTTKSFGLSGCRTATSPESRGTCSPDVLVTMLDPEVDATVTLEVVASLPSTRTTMCPAVVGTTLPRGVITVKEPAASPDSVGSTTRLPVVNVTVNCGIGFPDASKVSPVICSPMVNCEFGCNSMAIPSAI